MARGLRTDGVARSWQAANRLDVEREQVLIDGLMASVGRKPKKDQTASVVVGNLRLIPIMQDYLLQEGLGGTFEREIPLSQANQALV